MAKPRVFLSAVSNELREARRALRHDVEMLGWDVAIQEELDLTIAPTLLGVLAAHVSTCQAIVCLIGTRSGGGFPTKAEVDAFPGLLPPDLPRASYTQWEYFLARRHGVVPLVCCPRLEFRPETPDDALTAPDDRDLQAAFFRHVEASGVPRIAFGTVAELRAEVGRQLTVLRNRLTEPVQRQPPAEPPPPAERPAKPTVLPYPSLGALFKGRDDFLAQLRNSLTQPNASPTAITSNFAIHGLGGIGKTRAAVEYAWRHHDDYTALLAVIAETPDALTRNLAA
ncbi:MAG: DUF4062 domain-containing protein, partial [Acetobacteraceae bacterium]